MNGNYVVINIETTREKNKISEIIEIGITEIEDLKIRRTYKRLVKPSTFIRDEVEEKSLVTNEMVSLSKDIKEVLPGFRKFIGDKVIVSYNSDFDKKILNYYLSEMNLDLIDKFISISDLLNDSFRFNNKDLKNLEDALENYGVVQNKARVSKDTFATAQLFIRLIQEKDANR